MGVGIAEMKNALLICCGLAGQVVVAATVTENFDSIKAGDGLPAEWQSGFYGNKGSPRWKVELDKDAPSAPNVLKQSGNAIYNWLVKRSVSIKDGSIEAKIRVASGKEDPEAGVIWRFIDGKNYYYVRANSVENNIVVYKMDGGKKISVKSVDIPVGKAWHTIRAEFKDSSIAIKFDGKEVLSLQNSTIKKSGSAGFFTTADTVALFDDVKIEGK